MSRREWPARHAFHHSAKEKGNYFSPEATIQRPGVIASLNEPADVFLRANELKTTTADLKKRLAAEDIHANQVTGIPSALRLTERKSLFTSAAYREGLFEVQDAASQRIAPFLQVEPGMRVIDACAGAGGKSLHLAALMKNKGKIIALDVHDWKLKELRKRAGRAGADVIEARLIEDTKAIKRLAGEADRVLLSPPIQTPGPSKKNSRSCPITTPATAFMPRDSCGFNSRLRTTAHHHPNRHRPENAFTSTRASRVCASMARMVMLRSDAMWS